MTPRIASEANAAGTRAPIALDRGLPASAVPVKAAASKQKEQHDDYNDSFHDLFSPFSRETEHETCRSSNRTEQVKTAAKRRLPSSRPSPVR